MKSISEYINEGLFNRNKHNITLSASIPLSIHKSFEGPARDMILYIFNQVREIIQRDFSNDIKDINEIDDELIVYKLDKHSNLNIDGLVKFFKDDKYFKNIAKIYLKSTKPKAIYTIKTTPTRVEFFIDDGTFNDIEASNWNEETQSYDKPAGFYYAVSVELN